MNNIPNLKYKTTLCLSWQQGIKCIKNDDCYFAHGQHELRTLEQNRIAIAQRNQNLHLTHNPPNYKTVFCKFYGKGECHLGDACTFAHQRREKFKRSNTLSYQNEAAYQQYYAYYQMTAWMTQYSPYLMQLPSQMSYKYGESEMQKGVEEQTLTADSGSPALSKLSNESELEEKESMGVISQARMAENNEDQK